MSALFQRSVVGTSLTHLFDSSRHMMSDALIYRICQALATIILDEGQKGLFKHGRRAEDDDSQAVILVRQVQSGRQHGVIPANLGRHKVLFKKKGQCQKGEFLKGLPEGSHAAGGKCVHIYLLNYLFISGSLP